ncbi:GH25 family lysozyme [Lactobacillus johnsonii]|uniref:GH25 family lysozyme n=3 Tax=Lactobacillaceae TaxID=33958 RepID=UPI00398B1E42
MRSTNKKFISALACASAMTALAIVDPMGVTKTHQVAQAATDTIPAKSTGVDVSSWQGTKLDQQAKSGAQFAVVKVSEGTNYQNPNAQGQIQSAEQNNMMTMGYHYTHFGSNSNQAVQEGNYAVNSAQQAGLPQGSYLATDWEQDVNNNTNGSVAANTNAITSFMDTVHDGGYNPMLYSSEWLLKNKVDTNKISEKYPNALWVAKYKTNGREDNPDYNYFPSMDNVAIWQYTQNWRGQNVDGNVNVVPLSNKTTADNNNTSTNAANTNNSNANNGQSSSQAPANPIINNSNATAKPNNNNSTQPAQPTETKPAEKPSTTTNVNSDWTKQNGVFVTGGAINLRTGASTDSKVITQLPANSEVKYDAYRTIGQYTWLRQPRANNEYGYLVGRDNGQAWGTFKEGSATTAKPAETKPANKPAQPTETKPVEKPSTNTNANSDWTKQNGVFVTGGAINLRTGASTNSKVIAQLPANSEVKYDAYRTIGQYTWLRQPRANNEYCYLVGRDNGQAWGTFKEGSATTAKPAETKPANKPAQPTNKPSTTTNVNSDWTKQNGVFVTGGAINLRTGASTNSKVIAMLPTNTEIKYDAYRTEGQYTWLRQPRANNEYGYLVGRNNGQAWGTFKEGSATATKPAETKPAQPAEKPSTTTNVNSDWTKQNGVFVTGGAINLRTGASTNSKVITQLPANSEVKYDAYRTIGQYTWLRQPRANNEYGYLVGRNNGQAWGTFKESSAATKPAQTTNKPSQPAEKPSTTTNVNSDWTKQNGVFVTGEAINLRTGASTNSKVIAQLPANSEVKYDAYRTIGQYTWLRQPRANNQYGYLVGRDNGQAWGTFKEGSATTAKPAETKPAQPATKPSQPTEKPSQPATKPSTTTNVNSDWTKQNGVFVTGGAINLRTGASTDSKVITQLPANSEVKYDAYRTEGQYTWLRQPRANNEYGYLVGRDNGQAWGTFKEGSATTAKPNTNTTNNKPAENTNKPSQPSQNTQNEEKATWVKQEGTFITAGPINLRTAPSTKSAIIAQLPAGSEVNYDAYYQTGNYVWLRQPRANNQYGYLVGRNNGQAWGTFGKYRVLKDRADSTQYYTSQYNPVFAPWGCASAALSMLMKYDGTFKNVPGSTEYAKLKYMQDNLPRNKNLGGQDGNPYTGAGFTRVILSKALTNYAHQLGDKNVRDISGASLDTIANLVLDGHPVLYYGWSSYNGGGNMARNHCKVIMGYNGANNTFLVHDPLYMNKHFYKGGGGMREGIYNGYDLGPISWVSANSIAKEYAYKGGYNALTI